MEDYSDLPVVLCKIIDDYAATMLILDENGSRVGWPIFQQGNKKIYIYIILKNDRPMTESLYVYAKYYARPDLCKCIITIDELNEIHLYDDSIAGDRHNNYHTYDFTAIPRIDILDYIQKINMWNIINIPNNKIVREMGNGGFITYIDEIISKNNKLIINPTSYIHRLTYDARQKRDHNYF